MTLNNLRRIHCASNSRSGKPPRIDFKDWIHNRFPTDEELQSTYENTGEYLFQVVIDNPSDKHSKANKRPFIVREGVCTFNMQTEKYEWLIGSDDALSWKVVQPLCWKKLEEAPSFL